MLALKVHSRDPGGSLRLFQEICKVKTIFILIHYLPLFKLILSRVVCVEATSM